ELPRDHVAHITERPIRVVGGMIIHGYILTSPGKPGKGAECCKGVKRRTLRKDMSHRARMLISIFK
ncbi:MAG: hypothetical protein K9H11_20780, partial [Rhodospirillum sp.]|nr:hypothetical protein [Rhodospirillum sp.]